MAYYCRLYALKKVRHSTSWHTLRQQRACMRAAAAWPGTLAAAAVPAAVPSAERAAAATHLPPPPAPPRPGPGAGGACQGDCRPHQGHVWAVRARQAGRAAQRGGRPAALRELCAARVCARRQGRPRGPRRHEHVQGLLRGSHLPAGGVRRPLGVGRTGGACCMHRHACARASHVSTAAAAPVLERQPPAAFCSSGAERIRMHAPARERASLPTLSTARCACMPPRCWSSFWTRARSWRWRRPTCWRRRATRSGAPQRSARRCARAARPRRRQTWAQAACPAALKTPSLGPPTRPAAAHQVGGRRAAAVRRDTHQRRCCFCCATAATAPLPHLTADAAAAVLCCLCSCSGRWRCHGQSRFVDRRLPGTAQAAQHDAAGRLHGPGRAGGRCRAALPPRVTRVVLRWRRRRAS